MTFIQYKLSFTFFLIALILNYFLTKFKFLNAIESKKQIQDIHIGNPSRLGGLVIYLLFSVYIFLYERNLAIVFLCSTFLVIPAFMEDIKIYISPLIRLLIIITASFILIYNFPILPYFDVGLVNNLVNNKIFKVIFYTLALATVINGQNIIDGTNGLSGFTSLSIFSSILFLGFHLNDQNIVNISIIVISLLLAFLFFNYPFGKIFLGDGGSYFLGFLSGYLVIEIFSKYPELPTWSAVCILYYPTLEVVFSYFRKLIQRKSPFMPDNLHLHIKIFYLISNERKNIRLYNALVAPFLGIVWISPLALLPFSLEYPHWSILIVFCLSCFYLFFYFSIPEPNVKKINS